MSAMSAIGVVVSDLEGTLTSGETWRVIGTFLEEHGRGSAYRRLVYAGFPLIALSRLGLVNSQRVREQWFVRMTRLLAGLDQSAIGDLVERVVESMWANRREAVVRELEAHRQRGARLIIASVPTSSSPTASRSTWAARASAACWSSTAPAAPLGISSARL